jgi:hypothetical protein
LRIKVGSDRVFRRVLRRILTLLRKTINQRRLFL